MKLKNKLIPIITAAALAATVTPIITSCGSKDIVTPIVDPVQKKIFDIEGDTLKGFKSTTTQAEVDDYCKNGIFKIPAVKNIAADAFNAEKINLKINATNIEIPSTQGEIKARAFYAQKELTEVTWQGGIESSELKIIGESAFAFCTELTSFAFPKGLFTSAGHISENAFYCCSKLETLNLFEYDSADNPLKTPNWAFGIFTGTADTGTVVFRSSSTKEADYANMWTRLVYSGINPAWDAHMGSASGALIKTKAAPKEYLKYSNGGTTLEGVNQYLWPSTDTNFNTVIVPKEVTALSKNVRTFTSGWTNVKTWDLSESQITTITSLSSGDGMFKRVKADLIALPAIKIISDNSFMMCEAQITSSDNWASVTKIGAGAFAASWIESFTFKSGVSFGNNAFQKCSKLNNLDFTDFATAPGTTTANLFDQAGTSGTNTVKVATKGSGEGLEQLLFNSEMQTYLKDCGMEFDTGKSVHWTFDPATPTITDEMLFSYEVIPETNHLMINGWAVKSDRTEFTKDEMAKIFAALGKTSIDIPSTVTFGTDVYTITNINNRAFYDGTNSKIPLTIQTIKIPNTVTDIGYEAFKGWQYTSQAGTVQQIDLSDWTTCPEWTGTDIFSGVNSVGKIINNNTIENQIDLWRLNKKLKTFLTTIGITFGSSDWTLANSDTATQFTITDNIIEGWAKDGSGTVITDDEKIELAADKGYANTLMIPATVTGIAKSAFVAEDKITSTIPDSTATYPTGITTVSFDTSSACTTIGEKAFYAAPITTLDFKNAVSLTTIGANAFSGCSELATITTDTSAYSTAYTLPATLTSIGDCAFMQTAISQLILPEFTNEISLGAGAFAGNNYLVKIDVSAYSAVPTWTTTTNDVFANLAASGTIYIKSGITADTMLQYFNTLSAGTIDKPNWKEEVKA